MTDYKGLYEAKCSDYDELMEQFGELQEQTNLIINDLEEELKQFKRKNDMLSRQNTEQKDKAKLFKSSIEREVDLAQKQRNQFKKKFIQFEKKVIQLQIVNQSLESELRATKSRLSEYESQTQKTMEELALAQLQLEETHENSKQTEARLRGQLKEAEQELFALQQGRQKPEDIPKSEVVIHSDVIPSEGSQKQLFRETVKGIRQYLDGLEHRKIESRKMLLKLCSQ